MAHEQGAGAVGIDKNKKKQKEEEAARRELVDRINKTGTAQTTSASTSKTAEGRRNELRGSQGLQPSVNVGRVSSSGETHGGGAGSFEPEEKKEEKPRYNATDAEPTEIPSRELVKEKQIETRTYTPKGAMLTPKRTVKKAAPLTQEQREQGYERKRTNWTSPRVGPLAPWEMRAAAPKGRAEMQGDDWLSAAAKGATGGTVRVYNIKGVRVTEDDLRAAGYSEEVINALRGYVTTAGNIATMKQVAVQPTRRTQAKASWAPENEMAHRQAHENAILQEYRTVLPIIGDENAAREYVNGNSAPAIAALARQIEAADNRLRTGTFASSADREAFRQQYEERNEFYQTLLFNADGYQYIDAAIKDAKEQAEQLRKLGKAMQLGGNWNGTPEETAKLDEIQNRIAMFQNRAAKLTQLKNAKKAEEVVQRVIKNGDEKLMNDLTDAYNASTGATERAFLAGVFGDQSTADISSAEHFDADKKVRELEVKAKKKGYSDSDITIYGQYRYQQNYNEIFGPYLNWIGKHPVIGSATAAAVQAISSIASGPERLTSELAAAQYGGNAVAQGKMITDVVRQGTDTAARNIEESIGGVGGKVVSKVFQYSVSAAESFVMGVTMGSATSVMMGLNSTVNAYDDALERGMDKTQAIALGITSGIFEALFEYVSLDKIKAFNSTTLKGFKGRAVMLLKSAGVEASEEVFTDMANEIADFFVGGALSNYNEALSQGYTPAQYAAQFGLQLVDSAAGGAFSGGAFGLASAARQHGLSGVSTLYNNREIGKDIVSKGGDVTQVIGAAKASENTRTQKLGAKLEEKAQKGKNAYTLTGRVYNRIQGENIYDAARQRAIDLAAERGETLTDRQADAIATAVRESQETLRPGEDGTLVYTLSPGAETAVQEGIGKDVLDEYTGSKKTAAWAETTRRNFAEFARDTGAYVDDVARVQRIERGIRDRMAETNKALREGNGTQLVTKAVEGTFRTEGGKTSSVTIGGIDSQTENNAIRVVVDGDGKGGVQTTAVLDLRADAPAGTVTPADEAQRELYLALNGAVTGQLTQTVADDYGTGYRPDLTTPMSLPAANNLIAMYDPDVNRDAGAFVAWGYDAFKAASRGMAWQAYLDMYRDGSAAVYGQYITDAQLREAFRAGQAQFEAKPGVTRIGTKNLDSQELARLAALDEVFRRQGFSVIVVDHFEDINGYVSDRADVAVVALDSEEGLFEVAAFHEAYHIITRELGTKAGHDFVDAVLDVYRETVGDVQYGRDFRAKVAQYAEVGFGRIAAKDASLPTRALVEKYIPSMEGEAAEWKIKEEMAAQYFAGVAGNNMDKLVERLERTGGSKLVAKVREVLEKLVADIRAALNRLSGRDEAVRAALLTAEDKAGELLDLFNKYAEQTREERTARLTEQGERIREEAVRAESGEQSAESYSIKATRNMDYAEQLKLIEERKLNGSNSLYIGNAPALTAAGFSDAPFAMNQADFRKARREEGNNKNYSSHSVPLKYFKNLPQKLNDSVIFIDNGIKTTIVTDYKMLDNDGLPSFVVAGVWRDQKMDNDVVNQVKSAYPLDNFTNRLLQAGKDGKLVVTDKNKAEELLTSIGVTPAEQSSILGLAKTSIAQPAAGSQEGNGGTRTESRRTDADYMAAVERGDMDAAQEMVDEAAKAAGYDMHLYHGAKKGGGFTVFKDWQYFTADKEYANKYANREKTESLYDVYVISDRLFDTRKSEDKRIFEQFRREYGMGEIMESGLPDWTDGYDLSDIIEENDLPFDGIILDEGTQFYPDEKEYDKRYRRVYSYVIRNSNQIKSADPVTYDDNGNVIPLSERFNEEKEDIRWSRRTQTAREEMDAAVVGGEMLGQMLDAARDVLQKAHSEIDKASFDAWLQGEKTGGKVAARRGIMGVVKKYNDPQLTGMSNEQLTDRIAQGFMDLKDYDFGADELVYTVIDAMAAKAAGQSQSIENETREIIRGVTAGRKFVASDKDLGEITGTLGLTRGQLNRTLKQVYGFTIQPAGKTNAWDGLESIDTAMGDVAKALPNLFEGSSLFENSTADNGNAVNRVVWLYENRDQMEMEERTQGDELGLYKYDPDSDETLEATMTLYEKAYQEAANFAEDLIRLSPVHTVADAFEGTMSELKQATRGMMQRRAREIEAIREQIETAEAGLDLAAQTNAALTQEAAKKQRRIDSLTDQLAVAERDARRARDAGDEMAAALEEKVGGLKEQIAELKKELRAAKGMATRQKNIAEKQTQAKKEYFAKMRHKMVEQQRDTRERAKVLWSIEKNVKWFTDRQTNPSQQKHIPLALQKAIQPIADYFLYNSNVYTAAQITKLADWYDRLNDDKYDAENVDASSRQYFGMYSEDIKMKMLDLADIVNNRDNYGAGKSDQETKQLAGGKADDRLSLEELKELRDILKAVRHLIVQANSMYVQGKRVNYQEAGAALWNDVRGAIKTGRAAEIKKLIANKKLLIDMVKPIYLFREVIGGEMTKYFDDIREAQNRYAFRLAAAEKILADLDRKYEREKWFRKNETFQLDSGLTVTLDKNAVMQIYATHRREMMSVTQTNHLLGAGVKLTKELLDLNKKQSRTQYEALLKATKIELTEKDLRRIMDSLTQQQKDFADAVVGFMSTTCSAWGNEVSRELAGFDNFTERYYFPYAIDESYLYQRVGQQQEIRLKNIGFTKALKNDASKTIVLTGFMDVAAKHIGAMANYSTLTVPLENLQRVRNFVPEGETASVHREIMDVYGDAVAQYISKFLNDANGGARPQASGGWIRFISKFKRAAVSLNMSVVIQQYSAVVRASSMINPVYFRAGRGQWTEYEELKKYSGLAIIKELGGWDINTGRGTIDYLTHNSGRTRVDRFNNKLDNFTGFFAGKMDEIGWSKIWHAVKLETAHNMNVKYKRKGMSEEFYRRAAKRFNNVVDYTQVYDSTISRSQGMRNQDTFEQMITSFMAEPITSYNMLVFSGMKRNGATINKARAAAAFVGSVVVNSMLTAIVKAIRSKDEEPWIERFLKYWLEGVMGEEVPNLYKLFGADSDNKILYWLGHLLTSDLFVLNMIPGVKDILSLAEGWDVERSDMTLFSDVLKGFQQTTGLLKSLDEDADALTVADALMPLLTTLTNFTHLPLKSAYRDFWLATKYALNRKDLDMSFEGLRDFITTTWGDMKKAGQEMSAEEDVAAKFNVLLTALGYGSIKQDMKNMFSQFLNGEWDKNEQLYYAMIQGDKAALDKYLKVTDADVQKYVNDANDEFAARTKAEEVKTQQYHSNVQAALKQVDDRITRAAQALLDNDIATAQKLADAVVADGFDSDDVYKAIQTTRNGLKPPEPYETKDKKDVYLATYDMLEEAYVEGDTAFADALRTEFLRQGKEEKEINNKIAGYIKSDVEDGEIDFAEAKQAFHDFTTLEDKEINGKLAGYVDSAFVAGELNLAEARQTYKETTGYNDATITNKLISDVAKRYANDDTMTVEDAKKMYGELGVLDACIASKAAKLIVTDYKEGRITNKAEAVSRYMEQSGIDDSHEAEKQFDYIDLLEERPELDISASDYYAYVDTVQASNLSFEKFYEYTTTVKGMGADTANAQQVYFSENSKFGAKQAQILPIIYKMDITNDQKDAIFLAYWSEKNKDLTPWHNPGYWGSLLN